MVSPYRKNTDFNPKQSERIEFDTKDSLGFDKIRDLINKEAVSGAGYLRVEKLKPLSNLNEIIAQQNRISALRNLLDDSNDLPIDNFHDIREDLKRCKVSGSYFSAETLLQVSNILRQSDTIRQYFRANKETMKSLEFLITGLSPLNPVCRLINRIVDEEARIQDRASPELVRIRRDVQSEMRHLHRAIARLMNKAKSEDWLHEENPTIREGRLVLPLRTEYKRKVHGIIHGQSATGATTFIEPMEAVEINNRLKELEQEEKEEVVKILQQISGEIRPYFTELERNIVILIELDFIRACAKFSEKFKCSPPTISEQDRKIVLINSKHPLLSLAKKVVPLNLSLPDGISSMIITGPNAGGKTVAMKTVGLLSVMAMSGLHIPADEGSHIPFFDIFLVDIGDLQSIENDLSTFSSHVSNLKAFLDKATDQSLVLIDELGTGTEPVEGSALGQAVLERLVEKRAFTIVTTHHNALKAFADKSPNVVNAAMEFSTDTLSPTYRLRLGYPGSSYALEISKRLGLSDKVIDRARKIMGGDTVKLENLLLEAEKLKTKLEERNKTVAQNKKTLDKIVSEYESRLDSINQKYEKMDKELAVELEKIANESRSRIESAVKEIRERDADHESIVHARKIIEEIKQNAKMRKKTQKKAICSKGQSEEITVGSWVKVESVDEPGQVINISEKSNRVAVEISSKTLWVSRDSIKLLETLEKKKDIYKSPVIIKAEKVPSQKLDLRGMRVDEAESSLIKYLDQVILSGLNEIEIIHGMGTGVLQKMVWDVLKNFPGVRKFHFEDFDRGGTGATIVKL